MGAQSDAYLIIPYLNRVIPITATPRRWIRNLIDVVHQQVYVINLLTNTFEQTGDVCIVPMITLDSPAFTARFRYQPGRCIDGTLTVTSRPSCDINSGTLLP